MPKIRQAAEQSGLPCLQERIRLSERTLAALAKARKEGRIGGRPRVVVDRAKVEEMEEQGLTLREIASEVGISAASVSRLLRSRQRMPAACGGAALGH